MMDRLYYLTIHLALVVLFALPLYCELKNEESLNLGLMEETDDLSEATRIKRGLQSINVYGDSTFKIRKLRQTQKEKETSKQKIGDSKKVKRGNVLKPQSRDGTQHNLHAMSAKQVNVTGTDTQKSVKNNIKSIGNQKSQPRNHPSRTMIKSRGKSEHSKREIKLNTSKDLKSVAKKREVGTTNKTVNELQKNTLDKTSSSEDTDIDKDDKACVDENGAVKTMDETNDDQNEHVPAFDYFKTFSRSKQTNNTILSLKNFRNQKNEEEYEDNIRDQMKYTDGNKKYNSKNYKKPILQEKPSKKQYIAGGKSTKLSRKKA